jgi:hypothetical protein
LISEEVIKKGSILSELPYNIHIRISYNLHSPLVRNSIKFHSIILFPMTSFDWTQFVNWIIPALITFIFGALSVYLAQYLRNKRERKKEREKKENEERARFLMPNNVPPANVAAAVRQAEREGHTVFPKRGVGWQSIFIIIGIFISTALVVSSGIHATQSQYAVTQLYSQYRKTLQYYETQQLNTQAIYPIPSTTPYITQARDTCPGAPPIKVEIGDTARVTNNNGKPLFMRAKPEVGSNVQWYLFVGNELRIIDGPVCSNDVSFFKVEDMNTGHIGWVAEAESDSQIYLIVLVP